MIFILFKVVRALIVLCLPFGILFLWKKIAELVGDKVAQLKYERRGLEEATVYCETLSNKIDRLNKLYDNLLVPSNFILICLGSIWQVISYTGLALAALVAGLTLIIWPVDRCSYRNAMNGYYINKYENCQIDKLQSTTITEAEKVNDDLEKSFFITEKEKSEITYINTKSMWKRFQDAINNTDIEKIVHSDKLNE